MGLGLEGLALVGGLARLGRHPALHSPRWGGGASLPAILTPKQGHSLCQTQAGNRGLARGGGVVLG